MTPETGNPPIDETWPFRPWVRVERGGFLESAAQGLLVVVDDEGLVRASWGDPQWVSFLRSSAKMFQAIPVVESGAADRFALSAEHLAVCCASHSGERAHTRLVGEILVRAGVHEEHLHCGAHPPAHEATHHELILAGVSPTSIHNNCSGKHAGMLAACVAHGWDPTTYERPEHPLQREIARLLGEFSDTDPTTIDHATDGCGVPAFRLPVVRFAHALARFMAARGPVERHRDACERLAGAMIAHPDLVAGTGRFCTELARAANRPVLAKGGAEGFYAIAWRGAGGRGFALAAKAAAGDARSRECAVTEAARQFGLVDAVGLARLARFHEGPLRNHAGTVVGRLAPCMDLGRVDLS